MRIFYAFLQFCKNVEYCNTAMHWSSLLSGTHFYLFSFLCMAREEDMSGRGLASADEETRRRVASEGGRTSGGNFKNDPQRAREAGRQGGKVSGGNFKNDPQRASEAGRKGGKR